MDMLTLSVTITDGLWPGKLSLRCVTSIIVVVDDALREKEVKISHGQRTQ